MKTMKTLAALVAVLLVITTAACTAGSKFEEIAENIDDRTDTLQNDKDGSEIFTGTADGMPNPWCEVADMDEFSEKAGFKLAVPEDAHDIVLRVMNTENDTVLGEMIFNMDDMIYTARATISKAADSIEDISGLHYEWQSEEETAVGGLNGLKAIIRQATDGADTVEAINWLDAASGIVYSLSTIQPDVDGLDLSAIAEKVYIPMKSASNYTGHWILDTDATMANLSSHGDIYILFGSGLRDYGAEMTVSEDGTFYCRVGVGFYLDGNWKFDGEILTAEGQDGFSEEASVSFIPVKIDGVEALCMTYDNENVYWKRAAVQSD